MIRRTLSLVVVVFSLTLLGATAAGAQETTDVYGETPGQELPPVDENPDGGVLPEVLKPGAGGPAAVATPEVAGRQVSRAGLPVTGGDVVGLAALGGGAVLAGALLVAYRRRQTA